MPSQAEILRALDASLRLARGDQTGYRLFDQTIEGFWRSFSAVLLIAPMFMIADWAEMSIATEMGRPAREAGAGYYAGRLVTLGVAWIAYPVSMVAIAKLLMLGQRYAAYIIAYNWTSVLITLVLLVPGLLFLAGLIPAGLALLLNVAATVWALWFRYSIARQALQTSIQTAIAIVIFDVLLSVAIDLGSGALGF